MFLLTDRVRLAHEGDKCIPPYTPLKFKLDIFEDESHNSVIPVTISRGLRYIYGN